MEEYDDLVASPDASGKLELTYRGWTLVDDSVWTMGRELVILDISFNSILELPPELGDLTRIEHFNCSCNNLTVLPATIGWFIILCQPY